MVEVFKTNIEDKTIADQIVEKLQLVLPSAEINFDLDDCDNILRVESRSNPTTEVARLFTDLQLYCEVLE